MPIVNQTNNIKISENFRQCCTELSKIRGLMFTSKIREALIFFFRKESLQHIHMFFVWYPIDVLWLDKNKRVVQLKENLKPFTMVMAKRPAKYVIELKAGLIKNSRTELGNQISF